MILVGPSGYTNTGQGFRSITFQRV